MTKTRQIQKKSVSAGGRPRKFSGTSRPVTVTLPEETLEHLSSIDHDRAKAIVKAVGWAVAGEADRKPVEIIHVDEDKAIIVVGPSKLLREIPFLSLIEIAPKRFLLVIPSGTAVEVLEVALMDALSTISNKESYEGRLLLELQRCLAKQRRGQRVSKAELLLIDTSEDEKHF